MKRSSLKIVLVAIVGIGLSALIIVTGPRPIEASLPEGQPEVSTRELSRSKVTTTIQAFGTLTPRQSLQLTSQVPGKVIWVSQNLVAGGQLNEGEALFHIDQRDYAIAVAIAEARYAQSKANIDLELGRSENAMQEWSKWQSIQGANVEASALALRKPQQAEALALQAINGAELQQARLAFERTVVHAPWPASVIASNAVTGQIVSIGDVAATLYPLDYAVVELQVSPNSAALLSSGAVRVELTPVDNPEAASVMGEFEGIVKNLTQDTRLLTVRVRISEPLNNTGWAYGMHLAARIATSELRSVVELPASIVVSGNLIWVYRGGKAIRHQIQPLEHRDNQVLVEDNFEGDDRLIMARPIGLFDDVLVDDVLLDETGR